LFSETDCQDRYVRRVMRFVRLGSFDCGSTQERVVIFEADVDQRLNRARDFLDEKNSFGSHELLVGDQTAVQDRKLRIGEKRVASSLEGDLGAAPFSGSEGPDETE